MLNRQGSIKSAGFKSINNYISFKINRWQELQQNSSQPIRGNEGNEIEVMYEKIVVPRNDEVIVNVIRTVEHSRTVGTLPHLNDQTPGKSVNLCYGISFLI